VADEEKGGGGVTEPAKVLTFLDDDSEGEMTLLSVDENGVCKCLYENEHEDISVRVARRRKHVRPMNDAAREMLKEFVVGERRKVDLV
jgi:hypothetical protein